MFLAVRVSINGGTSQNGSAKRLGLSCDHPVSYDVPAGLQPWTLSQFKVRLKYPFPYQDSLSAFSASPWDHCLADCLLFL